MHLPASLKKVPRWTWYVTGGVIIGTGAIRLYQNRTTADTEETDTGGSTTAAAAGYGYGAISSGGVIVPPVIAPDDTGSGDPSAATTTDLAGAFIGGFGDIANGLFTLVDDSQNNSAATTGMLIDALANAGSNPAAQTTQVAATAAPAKVAKSKGASKPAQQTCKEMFPNYPRHDGTKGQPSERSCYKEDCVKGKSNKKMVHRIYKGGNNVRTATKCG